MGRASKEMQLQLDAIATRLHKDVDGFRAAYTGKLGFAVDQYLQEYRRATGAMYETGRQAVAKLEAIENNDLAWPEAKRRTVVKERQEARREIERQGNIARTVTADLRKQLAEAALPKVDAGRERLLRDELLMLVDSSSDPVQTLMEVAQRRDDLAALATSPWAESLLRARRVKDAPKSAQLIRDIALGANTEHPDEQVRLAAEAYYRVESDLAASIVGTQTWVTYENGLET